MTISRRYDLEQGQHELRFEIDERLREVFADLVPPAGGDEPLSRAPIDAARSELEITVRTELAGKVDTEFQAQLQALLDGLKQEAKIEQFVTVENN